MVVNIIECDIPNVKCIFINWEDDEGVHNIYIRKISFEDICNEIKYELLYIINDDFLHRSSC